MKRVPKKTNQAVSYGDDVERGGDLICFWRGVPMYLNPYAGESDFARIPDEGRPVRILVGRAAAEAIRRKARSGASGYSLPLVFA